MSKARDLTSQATEGYESPNGAQCPYLFSSPAWYAWTVGVWLNRTGRTAPRDVRMSRGSKVRANDLIFVVADDGTCERVQ